MSHHDHPQGDVSHLVREAIQAKLEGATVEVTGGGGHYQITVISPVFAGKGRIEQQRLVYGAITHLMAGHDAPVHAVDSLVTKVP
jgi:acid stress-induced BolA-like protein IbaG/YrbA